MHGLALAQTGSTNAEGDEMDRRSFMMTLLATPAFASLSSQVAAAPAGRSLGAPLGGSETRKAYRELLDLLDELDQGWVHAPGRIRSPFDESDAYRNVMHMLEVGLLRYLEADPEHPVFERLVSPTRKFLGDNPDAIYFGAFVRGDRRYRIRGNLAGAVYSSFTIEYGSEPGGMSQGVASVLNDSQFEVGADGNYEILVSPTRENSPGGWLELPANAVQITTRHYFESARSAAADPYLHIPLVIEPLDAPPPPPTFDDTRVAAGIRRVAAQLRQKTHMMPVPGTVKQPNWISEVPNHFPKPEPPGDIAFTALDAAYSMAPYALAEDEALVMRGRFPKCRFSNVVLWNSFLMTYDYAHRSVSLNREQTKLEPDGSFRIVLAHRDPGLPNWLDTEGRPSGLVYWRFFLPEEQPQTPQAEVAKLDALKRGDP